MWNIMFSITLSINLIFQNQLLLSGLKFNNLELKNKIIKISVYLKKYKELIKSGLHIVIIKQDHLPL